jgi:general secretion pathway protein D
MVLHTFLFLISFLAVLSQSISALPPLMPELNPNDNEIIEEESPSEIAAPLLSPSTPNKSTILAYNNSGPTGEVIAEEQMPTASQAPLKKSSPSSSAKNVSAPSKTGTQEEKDQKAAPDKDRKDIFLNFENSSLANVVNYMAELRGVNLLPDKALADIKVSLTIREALTVDGAWNIFMTLLEVSGFSIVEVGGLHKVLPKDKKLTEALPSYINVPYSTLPESDLTIRYVMFLQNLQVDSVKDLLTSLLSDKHTLYPYAQANCFIITDRCYNIKSAMKIIQELDTMGQPETVVVLRLKRTNATDVKGLIEGLMNKKQDTNPLARFFNKPADSTNEYFPAGTKIVAEERTNSLILMGSPDPIKKIEDFIRTNIDIPLKAAESPLHIYELAYADATQIAEILTAVTAPPDQGPGQQAAKYGAIRGGVKYFKSMKFQVDKEGNRLIVSCTDKQDWELLKTIIKDLDKPQPQVALETLFVSITANELNQMGGSIRNKKHGTLGPDVDFQAASLAGPSMSTPTDTAKDPVTLLGNMLTQLVSSQGSMLLSFGRKSNIWAVFETIKQNSCGTILSQPFLTIANKVTGKITVGDEQNVLMEDGGNSGNKGYGLVSADTSLEVEPQINLDGIIRMKINVNISEFTNATLGEKSNKKIATNVTMADGQVLVLGGFVQTKVGESVSQTPLLSNIPLLGWFFKNQKRTVDRTYIFIFMAPTIVKPRTAPGVELYSKMKLHEATNYIEDGIKTSKTHDPIFNWFFDPKAENYSHKVVDFANARYQPTSVDLKNDSYYRVNPEGAGYNEQLNRAKKSGLPAMAPAISIMPSVTTENKVATSVATTPKPIIETRAPINATSSVPTPDSTPSKESFEAVATNFPLPPTDNVQAAQIQAEKPSSAKKLPTLKDMSSFPKITSSVNTQALINDRLGLDTKNDSAPLRQMIGQPQAIAGGIEPRFIDQEIKANIESATNAEPSIVPQSVEPHPAQQEVLNLLGERMQQQRHASIDTDQLAHQRKKLKSLISQSFNTQNRETTDQNEYSKQAALKSILEVPVPETSRQRELVVDPVKRNSLKDFLSHAEQPASKTRNKPA